MAPRWSPPQLTLAAVLFAGFALRAWGAFDDGIFWPDEIYQSFEPAHSLVYGTGLIPWEFIDGARNWSVPGLVALLMQIARVFGLDTPPGYIRFVKLAFALAGTLAGWGVYRLARAVKSPEWSAVAAAAVYCFASPAIYFAPRAMSENACTAPLIWGLALLFEQVALEKRSTRTLIVGASLLGLSVLFRLQCVAVVAGAVVALAALKQWQVLKISVATLAVWAFFYGALDAATWSHAPKVLAHGWFHSAVVYVRFNVIEGRAAQWGTSPWWFYFSYSFRSMPTVAVALGLGLIGSLARRHWLVPFLWACFMAVHLASPHKEMRFIVPALPLACAMLGPALAFAEPRKVLNLSAVAVLLGLVSASQFTALTMGELGAYLDRPKSSAWGDFSNVNRLLMVAGKRADVCGVRIDVADMAWAGGATYLHTRVPLYRNSHPHQLGHFNYVIGFKGYSGAEVIATDGDICLYRLPIGACQPDPGFEWKL